MHEVLISLKRYVGLGYDHHPDFDHNWKSKINGLGWQIKIMKDNK